MSSKVFLNPSAENKTTNRIQRVSGMWLRLIVRDEERSGPLSSAPEQKMSSREQFLFWQRLSTPPEGVWLFIYLFYLVYKWLRAKQSFPGSSKWEAIRKKITTLGKYCRKVPCRYGNKSFPVRQQPQVILDATCETIMLRRLSFICATY